MLASNNLLIGMSVDRYFAVAVPLKFVKTGKILTTSEDNNDGFLHNKRYSLLVANRHLRSTIALIRTGSECGFDDDLISVICS